MIQLEPADVDRAVAEVQWLIEESIAQDGWKLLLCCRGVRTTDFHTFQIVRGGGFGSKATPGAFDAWIHQCVDCSKPLRWARDLFRRGLAPPLSTIEPAELLDTLMLADEDSDYDPAEEAARACLAALINQARNAGTVRVVSASPQPRPQPTPDKTQTVVATVVIMAFLLFALSMCSHRYSPTDPDQSDRQQEGAYR